MSEEMADFERGLLLNMGWCPADTVVAGHELRSLSVGSFMALEMMGLKVLEEEPGLSMVEETRQVGVYIWLHSAPLNVVWRALWSGDWRLLLDEGMEADESVVEDFRVMAVRLRSACDVARVRLLPPKKEDDEGAKLPSVVVGPSALAHQAMVVMGVCGGSWKRVVWRMPRAVFLQIYHAEMRWRGQWTARPGRVVAEDEFDDFQVAGAGPSEGADAGEHPLMNCGLCGEFRGHGHVCRVGVD